jgi:branched-chain amino acid transport system substrate-binding protein
VAVLGPATGADAPLGKPIMDAAAVAIGRFDAANPGCQVMAKQFDTSSGDVGTIAAAKSLIAEPSVLATIGPILSHEMRTVGDQLDSAGFLVVSPSATDPDLNEHGWLNFVRSVPDDDEMAQAGANFLTRRLGYQRICVVGQDYGVSTDAAEVAKQALGDAAIPGCALTIGDDPHLNAEVLAISDAKPQAVYFTGFASQAATLLNQMRANGVDATFMGWDGVFDEQFLTVGGNAVRGALILRGESPATPELAARLSTPTGTPTALYAVEGYEIASIMMQAVAAGATNRTSMRDYFRTFSGSGSFRHYAWTDDGQPRNPELQLYQVN